MASGAHERLPWASWHSRSPALVIGNELLSLHYQPLFSCSSYSFLGIDNSLSTTAWLWFLGCPGMCSFFKAGVCPGGTCWATVVTRGKRLGPRWMPRTTQAHKLHYSLSHSPFPFSATQKKDCSMRNRNYLMSIFTFSGSLWKQQEVRTALTGQDKAAYDDLLGLTGYLNSCTLVLGSSELSIVFLVIKNLPHALKIGSNGPQRGLHDQGRGHQFV